MFCSIFYQLPIDIIICILTENTGKRVRGTGPKIEDYDKFCKYERQSQKKASCLYYNMLSRESKTFSFNHYL